MPYYYNTNNKVSVGDSVRYAGKPGKIVFVSDDGTYSDEYPKKHWGHLHDRIGFKPDDGDLICIGTDEEDLELKNEKV